MLFLDCLMQAGLVALALAGTSAPAPQPTAATSRFEASLARVLAVEGGYAEHRADSGGATKYGITRRRLAQHRGRAVSKSEVRALTTAEATVIYRAMYWDALRGDELPAGIDHAVFDFAVHSGVPRAVRALQRAVGVAEDGRIGPATLAAARKADAELALARLCADRLAFMTGLSAWGTFGRGWSARLGMLELCPPAATRMATADAGAAATRR